ncbi:MAG: hypothetical protein AB9856_05385 [Cellulosilyticaceae bacterium]
MGKTMALMNVDIKTNLAIREIERGEDVDLFIDTKHCVVECDFGVVFLSRFQFPNMRAILVRTSPYREQVTIHLLADTDLLSSFMNFELNLSDKTLHIMKSAYKIEMYIEESLENRKE